VSVPIDQSRDVDDAGGSEGVLCPGVGDLSVDEGGVGIDGRPGTRLLVGEADCCAPLRGKGDSDEGRVGVYPGGAGPPND